MAQEDKQQLLKDLCSRLPYGVKVRCIGIPKNPYYDHTEIDGDFELLSVCPKKGMATIEHYGNYNLLFTCCIPYLRQMSSMTDKERTKIAALSNFNGLTKSAEFAECSSIVVDYCNSRYLDYHGLIEKGLALEAPEGMYNV